MKDIITEPGVYATREGRLAFISKCETDPETLEYRFHGSVLVLVRGRQTRESHIWRADGSCLTSDDDGQTVVSKV